MCVELLGNSPSLANHTRIILQYSLTLIIFIYNSLSYIQLQGAPVSVKYYIIRLNGTCVTTNLLVSLSCIIVRS